MKSEVPFLQWGFPVPFDPKVPIPNLFCASGKHTNMALLDHKDIGAIQRAVIIGSAIYCCLVTAGTAFGFSALMPSLLKVGAFAKVCPPGMRSCNEQIARSMVAKSTCNLYGLYLYLLLQNLNRN